MARRGVDLDCTGHGDATIYAVSDSILQKRLLTSVFAGYYPRCYSVEKLCMSRASVIQ